MTRDIDYMVSVMQAFKEGKTIECRSLGAKWGIISHPKWNWIDNDYRVKAEPKYRPYANTEECFKDVQKHGGWILDKDSNFLNITAIGEKHIWINRAFSGFAYSEVVSDFVWADDGSPVGVLEE